jgi:hypothetical protein
MPFLGKLVNFSINWRSITGEIPHFVRDDDDAGVDWE